MPVKNKNPVAYVCNLKLKKRCSRHFMGFHPSWSQLKVISAVGTVIFTFNQIGALTEHSCHFSKDPLGFLLMIKIHSLPLILADPLVLYHDIASPSPCLFSERKLLVWQLKQGNTERVSRPNISCAGLRPVSSPGELCRSSNAIAAFFSRYFAFSALLFAL